MRKLVCVLCESPIETKPGYPDVWRCPLHGEIGTAKYIDDIEEVR